MRGRPFRCVDCQFRDSLTVTCRVKPPVADGVGHAVWPRVAADDWCGEYAPHNNEAGSVTTIGRDGVTVEDWPKRPKPDGKVVFVSESKSMSKELWDKLKV
jgi:hypothetical protein